MYFVHACMQLLDSHVKHSPPFGPQGFFRKLIKIQFQYNELYRLLHVHHRSNTLKFKKINTSVHSNMSLTEHVYIHVQ